MNKKPLITRLAAAAMLTAFWLTVPAAASADVRDEFREAIALARQYRDPPRPDSPALRSYLLYPDLQAARLISALSREPLPPARDALDDQVEAFLDSHPELPADRDLRAAWLDRLARQQRWQDYLGAYRPEQARAAQVCTAFQARIASGEHPAALARELRDFWVTAPQMPSACVEPFDWLKARGMLTPPVIAQRARKALSDGNRELAAWLLRMLPAKAEPKLHGWLTLLRSPSKGLDDLARNPRTPFEWSAVLRAYQRLAAARPDDAQALLSRLDPLGLDRDQHAQLVRALALGYAWDRRPEAITWFRQLPESAADESVQEWRVRAALWHREPAIAADWLQKMPSAMAGEDRWIYWRGRMAEALGRGDDARTIYRGLTAGNGYYNVLAAWRLGQAYVPHARELAGDAQADNALLERRAIVRARELHLTHCDIWANRQWAAATRDLTPAQRLEAARLASSWGWHIQAVSMLASADALDVLDIRYPNVFETPIERAAHGAGIPPEWIYGVMRQESLFNPRATSPSNAYGLLQLLLPTARGVARKLGRPRPDADDLFRPEVNIPLGAGYLGQMRERFDGQFAPTIASYNAGPNAVSRWLPEQPMEADFWIENVPYNQTRHYVQNVLWHIAVHRWRLSGKPQTVDGMLAPVRTPAAP